jgi:hypothetical protein
MSNKTPTERAMLFNAPMVRALLNGSKTQTRRVAIKTSQPDSVFISDYDASEFKIEIENTYSGTRTWTQCPYGVPGDRLWVRETFHRIHDDATREFVRYGYRADRDWDDAVWSPSIHMPRAASRILLEIVSVRVERLQDISEADAISEGIEPVHGAWRDYQNKSSINHHPAWSTAIGSYRSLWESINGAGSWDLNPLVWVIEFKRVTET